MEESKPLMILNPTELRVLGSLIEKSKTTPDYYPMTINSLVAACNQKTSRNPVVNYTEETVTLTLNALKIKGLVGTATGAGSRVVKYKHNLAIVYPLLPAEVAVICLLMLRGPLTPGEINTNSARLYEFDTIEDVNELLQKLASEVHPYVKQLPKRPGQKEARFIHLFGDETTEVETEEESYNTPAADTELLQRIAKLEQEVEELKEMVNLLMEK